RVRSGRVREVIMATNPTTEGDGTALYLSTLLGPLGVKVTRLARGLPAGSGVGVGKSQMRGRPPGGPRGFSPGGEKAAPRPRGAAAGPRLDGVTSCKACGWI